ncbi:unnamed protein product [Strongylus vulgaris]|uniref:Uncharacterized protein n=1 Tax=Strongylus vulgaris TaxID=40348 RepID=A0A3P7L673_STRVU|nr:unnamed protein product [Strongylus vulgaris]
MIGSADGCTTNPRKPTFRDETFSPRMVIVDAPYGFAKDVKIGVGGDCPGVVGAKQGQSQRRVVGVSFGPNRRVLCNLTLVL